MINKINQLRHNKNLLLIGVVSLFSACGLSSVSKSTSEDILFEEQVEKNSSVTIVEKDAVVSLEQEPEHEVTVSRPSFSSAKGYWLAAIEYLQNGEESHAQWALEHALALNPKSKISKKLLDQIKSDANDVLGDEYFRYTIQDGDSLSKISQLYLNDSLQFYMLAKYNDISNPGRLLVGNEIKIPGSKPFVEKPLEQARGESTTEIDKPEDFETLELNNLSQLEADLNELLNEKEYASLIVILEAQEQSNATASPKLTSMLVEAYYLSAQQLLLNDKKTEAKALLNKAIAIEPDNEEVNMALIDLDDSTEALALTDQSIKALAANSPIEAYELINRALVMQPDLVAVIEQRQETKRKLSSYYYKRALMAQRRQELDKAVNYWDEVLALDINNQNAKLYRAKSIVLRSKMKKFVSVDH